MKFAKSYSELIRIPTYEERFKYLKITKLVGEETFGSRRSLNQSLYSSPEWVRFRKAMIVRDSLNSDYCCDMAFFGKSIGERVVLHHINPLTIEDLVNKSSSIFDPENVVCVAYRTHEAIHYGNEHLLIRDPIIRTPGDTCPWRS